MPQGNLILWWRISSFTRKSNLWLRDILFCTNILYKCYLLIKGIYRCNLFSRYDILYDEMGMFSLNNSNKKVWKIYSNWLDYHQTRSYKAIKQFLRRNICFSRNIPTKWWIRIIKMLVICHMNTQTFRHKFSLKENVSVKNSHHIS